MRNVVFGSLLAATLAFTALSNVQAGVMSPEYLTWLTKINAECKAKHPKDNSEFMDCLDREPPAGISDKPVEKTPSCTSVRPLPRK